MPFAKVLSMNATTRILILDKDPKAAEALGKLLELYYPFIKFTVAFTGLSTVHLACSGGFDVVLIELHLGEDDGVDVAKAIRSRCATNVPKLIAVSGDRASVAIERSGSSFDLALNKPLVVKELHEAIHNH